MIYDYIKKVGLIGMGVAALGFASGCATTRTANLENLTNLQSKAFVDVQKVQQSEKARKKIEEKAGVSFIEPINSKKQKKGIIRELNLNQLKMDKLPKDYIKKQNHKLSVEEKQLKKDIESIAKSGFLDKGYWVDCATHMLIADEGINKLSDDYTFNSSNPLITDDLIEGAKKTNELFKDKSFRSYMKADPILSAAGIKSIFNFSDGPKFTEIRIDKTKELDKDVYKVTIDFDSDKSHYYYDVKDKKSIAEFIKGLALSAGSGAILANSIGAGAGAIYFSAYTLTNNTLDYIMAPPAKPETQKKGVIFNVKDKNKEDGYSTLRKNYAAINAGTKLTGKTNSDEITFLCVPYEQKGLGVVQLNGEYESMEKKGAELTLVLSKKQGSFLERMIADALKYGAGAFAAKTGLREMGYEIDKEHGYRKQAPAEGKGHISGGEETTGGVYSR